LAKEVFTQELTELFGPHFAACGLELVDLIYRHENKRSIITILADKLPGGITLQECALLCRQLKHLLEEKNIIEEDYVLEVSSPGLDRSLKNKKDFQRYLNKEAVFFLNDLLNGKCQWQGIINEVSDMAVFVQSTGQVLEIPLTKINKAQLVIL